MCSLWVKGHCKGLEAGQRIQIEVVWYFDGSRSWKIWKRTMPAHRDSQQLRRTEIGSPDRWLQNRPGKWRVQDMSQSRWQTSYSPYNKIREGQENEGLSFSFFRSLQPQSWPKLGKWLCLNVMEGSVGGVSGSWFQFWLWSQGHLMEPWVRLHSQHRVCLRFPLSLSLSHPYPAHSLSFSK